MDDLQSKDGRRILGFNIHVFLLNVTIVLLALLLYYKLPTYRVIGSGCDQFVGEEMQRKCYLMVHVK